MKHHRSMGERLGSQRALLGLLQTHPNAEMAEMCGYSMHLNFSDLLVCGAT